MAGTNLHTPLLLWINDHRNAETAQLIAHASHLGIHMHTLKTTREFEVWLAYNPGIPTLVRLLIQNFSRNITLAPQRMFELLPMRPIQLEMMAWMSMLEYKSFR